MQENNKVNMMPETAKARTEKTGAALTDTSSGRDKEFAEEALTTDNTDYETDWTEFDIPDTADNSSENDGRVVKDSAYYDREIKKLKKKREQHENHYARMRNKMKGELRKDRNARLVMWGAEFEYQIGKRNPSLKKLLPYLDRDMQKKIIWHIFAEIRTGPLIIKIKKRSR